MAISDRVPPAFHGVTKLSAGRAIAQLHDGHDVQGSVDSSVSGTGQPVPLVGAGEGV